VRCNGRPVGACPKQPDRLKRLPSRNGKRTWGAWLSSASGTHTEFQISDCHILYLLRFQFPNHCHIVHWSSTNNLLYQTRLRELLLFVLFKKSYKSHRFCLWHTLLLFTLNMTRFLLFTLNFWIKRMAHNAFTHSTQNFITIRIDIHSLISSIPSQTHVDIDQCHHKFIWHLFLSNILIYTSLS